MQLNPRLKHVDEGAVSISLNGDEVAIALGRAVPLNSTHQVWSGAALCDKPDVMLRHMRVTRACLFQLVTFQSVMCWASQALLLTLSFLSQPPGFALAPSPRANAFSR